ncbi:hypothetical protein [Luteimonas dalianensis]|uniref:hypothetical protein n=1 Tax=Luteimonas dalianensis TaxID=1148196 RepID=UPI003BF4BC2D
MKHVVRETGFNDSPLFGARKAKSRVMAEFVAANNAVVISAARHAFAPLDAIKVIEHYQRSAQASVFNHIAEQKPDFEAILSKRQQSYSDVLRNADVLPPVFMASEFLSNLGLDPHEPNGLSYMCDLFLSNYQKTIGVLHRLHLMPGGA